MDRVHKILSNYGYCSRRRAEHLIRDGKVKVNGKVITLGDKATDNDTIEVLGEVVTKPRRTYVLFNKPLGCVTAMKDDKYKTVNDYVKLKERVYPVGRLDYNTTGLLILTNDGDYANKIMHPSNKVKKTYIVQVDREVPIGAIKNLQRGMKLKDGKTAPARVHLLEPKIIMITIHEGKNRIVRRMLEQLDLKILRLERIRIGKLELGNLKQGKYRILKKKEADLVFRR